MIEEDYFYNINIPVDFVDNLYEELNYCEWYTSSTGMCRSDIVGETRIFIEKFMPFEVHCCGFFKNTAGWKYPVHKDYKRYASFNMQLCDDSEDYHIYSYTDDLKEKLSVPYYKNKPVLLNTKKFHSVHNTSKDKVRYILTVGCTTEPYEVLRDKFKQLTMKHTTI